MDRSVARAVSVWGEDAVSAVLTFWFDTIGPNGWFGGGPEIDREIFTRFLALHRNVSEVAKDDLLLDADHALAAIIVLDQFSRQMFRGSARAFESDPKALELAVAAVARGYDAAVAAERRVFFYLPFEHAESLGAQERSVALVSTLANDDYTRYAIAHRDVIKQFGRFPHRNAVLRRLSTDAERAYLATPGAGF